MKYATTQLTAMANMLPPLNFVGSDRCCAVHSDKLAMKISDTVIIAFMLSVYGDWRTAKAMVLLQRQRNSLFNSFSIREILG